MRWLQRDHEPDDVKDQSFYSSRSSAVLPATAAATLGRRKHGPCSMAATPRDCPARGIRGIATILFNKGSARNDISFRPTFRTPVLRFLLTMRMDCGLHGIALVSSNH